MEVMLLSLKILILCTKKNLELFAIFFAKLLTSARSSFTQKKLFYNSHSFLEFVVYFCKKLLFLVCSSDFGFVRDEQMMHDVQS